MNEKFLLLVEKAINNDSDAFAQICTDKGKLVIYLCKNIMQKQEDAEDAAQEVFIQMQKSINTLRAPEAFNVWLNRIVFNTCKNLRRGKMKKDNSLSFNDISENFIETSFESIPHNFLENAQTRQQILDVLDGLPENYRLSIQMFYYEDMKYSEISEVLGVSVDAITGYLRRAKTLLRLELEEKPPPQLWAAMPMVGIGAAFKEIFQSSIEKLVPTSLLESCLAQAGITSAVASASSAAAGAGTAAASAGTAAAGAGGAAAGAGFAAASGIGQMVATVALFLGGVAAVGYSTTQLVGQKNLQKNVVQASVAQASLIQTSNAASLIQTSNAASLIQTSNAASLIQTSNASSDVTAVTSDVPSQEDEAIAQSSNSAALPNKSFVGALAGRVVMQNSGTPDPYANEGVAGLQLELVQNASPYKVVKKTKTLADRSNGYFILTDIKPGEYRLRLAVPAGCEAVATNGVSVATQASSGTGWVSIGGQTVFSLNSPETSTVQNINIQLKGGTIISGDVSLQNAQLDALPLVIAILKDPQNRTISVASTDEKGHYAFVNPMVSQQGTYTVNYELDTQTGFKLQNKQHSLQLAPGKSAVLPACTILDANPPSVSIKLLGGDCDCGHENPSKVEIIAKDTGPVNVTWQITKYATNAVVGSGNNNTALNKAVKALPNGDYYVKAVATDEAKNASNAQIFISILKA